MTDVVKTMLVGAIGAILVMALMQLGIVRIRAPWADIREPGDLTVERDLTTLDEPATVVDIAPVALDCRARVTSEVTVRGTRTHSLAGMVIRTDTVTAHVAGDVDTCVDPDLVVVRDGDDGVTIEIPGDAIQFVRPRVDLLSPVTAVSYDKGFLGEVTDLLPGVSDGDDMEVQALAFAQTVIGSGECMRSAMTVTEQLLRESYTEQGTAGGMDSSQIDVQIGEPDMDQNDDFQSAADTTFEVEGGVQCVLADDAFDGAVAVPIG